MSCNVKADPTVLRQFASDIKRTISDLKRISQKLNSSSSNLGEWNDSQSTQFVELVKKISKLVTNPCSELENCIRRIDKMASALEKYSNVKL